MTRTQPDLLRHESDFPVSFGRYTLQGILGEGGMARVFRAELQGSEGFRKPAAVKIVRAAVAADNDNLRRALINEARVGGLLHHPNVVETYDYGEVEGHPYIAMEYVRGVVLDEMLATVSQLEPTRCLDIAMQICAGLDHAHNLEAVGQETNLVHRDLKPSNIIISRDGLVKVMDFGIAKASALSSTLTQTGTTKGTPAYMSPEQVGGQKLDRRSDLFSLGAIIVELALGRRLFRGDTLISVLSAVIQVEERLADSDILEQLDSYCAGLGHVVQRCLRMSPEARYPDAAAIEADLQKLATGLPTASPMKLWVRELMEQSTAKKAPPTRSSWSSLDDNEPIILEPTLQTDAPPKQSPRAATEASVGPTRAHPVESGGGGSAAVQAPISPTRAQPGYPASQPSPSTSSQNELDQPKPPGTLWTPPRARKGLPAGLLIGLFAGLVLALAAVGAMVLGERLLGEQQDNSKADFAKESSEKKEQDLPSEAIASLQPNKKSTVNVAGEAPKKKTTRPKRKTPRTAKPEVEQEKSTETAPEPEEAKPEPAEAKPEPAEAKPEPEEAKPEPAEAKASGTVAEAAHLQRKSGPILLNKPATASPSVSTAEVSDEPTEPTQGARAEKPTSHATKTQARTRRSEHRRSQEAASQGILADLERHYIRRPKWIWESDTEDGRRRGYFMLRTNGMSELKVIVAISLPSGLEKKLKMRPSGQPGATQTWRSRITFPKEARGTVRWDVQVRGERTDGESIKRNYSGKEFRL